MSEKPTYEELEQRVKKLEKEFIIRKRAEEALREKEATLRSIFRAAPAGIGTVCDRVIRQANERLCEMIGYSQEELSGKNARMLYPSDEDFEYVGREKYAQISKRGIGTVETRWQRKDGKVIDVLLSSAPIDPNDWSTGVTFTALDITKRRQAEESLKQAHDELERRVQERTTELEKSNTLLVQEIEMHKQAEKALRESEARFSKLSEATWEAIVIHDHGVLLQANDQYYQMFGYEPAELLGKEAISMTATPESVKTIRKHINSNSLGTYEAVGMRKDGTKFPMEIRSKKMEYFNKKVRVTAVRDITERKQSDAALRESEERFRSLIEQAADGVITHDLDGQIIFVNEQAVQDFGYTKEELLLKNMAEISADVIQEKHKDKYWKKLKPNRPISIEVVCRRKDGSLFPAEVRLVQIILKSERIILTFGRDISERKRAEKELRKREAELEIQSQHLQEVNSALKVLLQQREEDKNELQENIIANVKELVAPYLDKLSQGKLDERQKSYIGLAQANLNDIISPFIGNLSSKYLKLTPTEIQVASLIKHGKTTKEIAELLNLSVETIKFHRKNIRGKIGIKNKKINLRTCLASMQGRGGK